MAGIVGVGFNLGFEYANKSRLRGKQVCLSFSLSQARDERLRWTSAGQRDKVPFNGRFCANGANAAAKSYAWLLYSARNREFHFWLLDDK